MLTLLGHTPGSGKHVSVVRHMYIVHDLRPVWLGLQKFLAYRSCYGSFWRDYVGSDERNHRHRQHPAS